MSAAFARSDSPPTDGATGDSGLAEWATRIKEMQRQVDADEEAEQRRLEEEISGDFGLGMRGIDTTAVRSMESDESISSTREKLIPPVTYPKPITKVAASGMKRAPISLAEFMGGSASGPRLKRHEPQIDPSRAYDGRMEHGPVHPIFGRGGVAMPGMVGQGSEGTPASTTATVVTAASSTNSPVQSNGTMAAVPHTPMTNQPRPRTTSTLTAALRYVEKLNEQAPLRAQTPRLSGLGIRERRTSTPGGSSSSENKKTVTSDSTIKPQAIHSATDSFPKVLVSHAIESHSNTSASNGRDRDPIAGVPVKALSDDPQVGTQTQNSSSTFTNRPSTSSTSSHVPPKPPYASSDQMSPERGSAPVFLRPRTNSTKDPTPSISRLQGRGFVQSIVRASEAGSQVRSVGVKNVLPSSLAQTSSESEMRDKFTRRASVLDRWQPGMNNPPPSPSSRMCSPTRSQIGNPKPGQDILMLERTILGVSKADATSEQGVDKKLGSASTKFTLIKPARTGDNPPVSVVDELGIRKEGLVMTEVVTKDFRERDGAIPTTPRLGFSASPSSGKPLSHVRPPR
ncbi:hypothetical protein EDC04DRAFT_2888181 [Pisolithus marmoratus]|nr:hypothetical protein EDC04DRAFT_2888181 [Pisolithus marmoratus]